MALARARFLTLLPALGLAPAPAHAQCQPQWLPPVPGPDGPVTALATYNGELIAGGLFSNAGAQPALNIARWNGSAGGWAPLGSGTNNQVYALAVRAGLLYAAGAFTTAGGSPAQRIAAWNGLAWSPLGPGLTGNGPALALTEFQGDLIAGGFITNSGTTSLRGVGRWNGSTWSALPAWPGSATAPFRVRALAAIGGSLFAGGDSVQTPPFNFIIAFVARTDGVSPWESPDFNFSTTVNALTPWAGGVAFGGLFSDYSAHNVAAWDGIAGHDPTPLGCCIDGTVSALAVYRGELLAAGNLGVAGSPTCGVARWNGTAWVPLSGSVAGGYPLALHTRQGALHVGGSFTTAGSQPNPYWARWSCPCYPNCDNSTAAPTLNVADFTCFLQSFAAAHPYANCDASTTPPTLNVADFTCFLQTFAAGCP